MGKEKLISRNETGGGKKTKKYGGQEIGGRVFFLFFFLFKLEMLGMVQKRALKLYTNSAARREYVRCKSRTSNRCEGEAGWEGQSRGGINPY